MTVETTTKDKQITIDVPEDRVAEFYAFYGHFLAGFPGRRRRGPGGRRPGGRGSRGPGGPGGPGEREHGHGHEHAHEHGHEHGYGHGPGHRGHHRCGPHGEHAHATPEEATAPAGQKAPEPNEARDTQATA